MLVSRLAALREDWPDAGMLDPGSSAIQQCGEELEAAVAAFAAARRGAGAEPPTVDALDFLLQTLARDLRDLIRVLQGPRQLRE